MQRDKTTRVIIRVHTFMENLRRRHREPGVDALRGLTSPAGSAVGEHVRAISSRWVSHVPQHPPQSSTVAMMPPFTDPKPLSCSGRG